MNTEQLIASLLENLQTVLHACPDGGWRVILFTNNGWRTQHNSTFNCYPPI